MRLATPRTKLVDKVLIMHQESRDSPRMSNIRNKTSCTYAQPTNELVTIHSTVLEILPEGKAIYRRRTALIGEETRI